MIFPGSRYEKVATYITVSRGRGEKSRPVTVLEQRLPQPGRLLGFHARKQGQRLDHIASRYLGDSTRFWSLCDVAGPVPDALAARERIGIPVKE